MKNTPGCAIRQHDDTQNETKRFTSQTYMLRCEPMICCTSPPSTSVVNLDTIEFASREGEAIDSTKAPSPCGPGACKVLGNIAPLNVVKIIEDDN